MGIVNDLFLVLSGLLHGWSLYVKPACSSNYIFMYIWYISKGKRELKYLGIHPKIQHGKTRVFERLRSAPNRNVNENRGLWKTCEEIIAMKFPNLKKKKKDIFSDCTLSSINGTL